jgi:RES domain-containing protein
MDAWRIQARKYGLKNSEGAFLTGGRWNMKGTRVIYASESPTLAALEVMVHHGGIPIDYVGIHIAIPDDITIHTMDLPSGWPDLVPAAVTAEQGTQWATSLVSAVLRVPSVTMSHSGSNYILNPAHKDFRRIRFSFEDIRFDARLRPRIGPSRL